MSLNPSRREFNLSALAIALSIGVGMTGFRHDIAGGQGNLIAESVQSPNFRLTPTFEGWQINKDGTAYFADIVLPDGQGVSVFFSATAPVSSHVGDLWYNIANGLQLSQWNGSSWVPYQIGSGAIATGGVEPVNISTLTASLIGNLGVLNVNPYFQGGDSTGWGVGGAGSGGAGTLAITNTPPAGSPSPWAALATCTVAGGLSLAGNQAQAFPAIGGQQYLVSGWVNPNANATMLLGFTFWDSSGIAHYESVSNAVSAGTWTQLTGVLTAPANTVNARVFVENNSATTPVGFSFYAASLIAMPQVPGGLIQTGTVTATQIAANTITAAQIAANTITAGQIAANTITVSQLAAGIVYAGIINGTTVNAATFSGSTFEGTDFELNSLGAFWYSGTPASGNLIASIASAAGSNDGHGNAFQAGINIYGASAGLLGMEFFNGGNPAGLRMVPDNAPNSIFSDPGVASFSNNTGTAQYTGVALESGELVSGSGVSTLTLYGGSTDGTTSIPHAQVNGGATGGTLLADITQKGIYAGNPASPGNDESWHAVSIPAGMTGTIRVKILPLAQFAVLDINATITSDSTTGQTYTTGNLPSASYYPANRYQYPLSVNQPMGTSPSFPRVNIPASGALQIDMPGFATGGNACLVFGTIMYPLD